MSSVPRTLSPGFFAASSTTSVMSSKTFMPAAAAASVGRGLSSVSSATLNRLAYSRSWWRYCSGMPTISEMISPRHLDREVVENVHHVAVACLVQQLAGKIATLGSSLPIAETVKACDTILRWTMCSGSSLFRSWSGLSRPSSVMPCDDL